MTLSLSTLSYNYKNNTEIKDWLEKSYKVNGFNSPSEDILSLYAQLKSNSGFNPFDSLDTYSTSLETGPLGDYINAGVKSGSLNPYYKQSDNDYYSYTNATGYQGVEIATNVGDLGNVLDPSTSASLEDKVNSFMATTDFTSISGNQNELTKLYKQLSTELQGLKEYTLTNTEIQSVMDEINTLNGAGVLANIKSKIDAGQDELLAVFKNQLNKIMGSTGLSSTQAIFKEENDVATANNDSNSAIKTKLFGNGTVTDYEDNPFYQYYVGLRTNKNLVFKDTLTEAIPAYNTNSPDIPTDTYGTFKIADYTGISSGDAQLGPLDILDKLYITQELKALYKQYEESMNKSRSMELSLTLAVQNSAEFDFRKRLAEKVLSLMDTEHQLQVSNESEIAKTIKRGSITGPSALNDGVSSTLVFDGFYGDVNTKATPVTGNGCLVDPYEIVINGNTYILGQDTNSNGNIDNVSEILGITDSADNPFKSLLQLDANKDGIVSKDELVRNGIVLKAVDDSGKLTNNSFDISLINNIDLKKLNLIKNGNSAGTFEMTFLNGRTSQGSQTFENQAYFNTLFDKLVDLRPYQSTTTTPTTSATSTTTLTSATAKTTTTKTSATAATSATSATSATAKTTTTSAASTVDTITRDTLLKQINSMYNSLIVNDTPNVETILDNICWKTNTILTPAQRIKIVDGIDPLIPVYQVEAKINTALKTLNK